ncbi:MAG: hypothetical protein IJC91_04880 [Oscillospiraceae bacterium]|nr:hypothetical protein [Oscillospiraceae bacterium]
MDFNLLKKKAAETANVLADKSAAFAKVAAEKSAEVAKTAAEKTKYAAKLAKLKTEAAAERDGLRKAYGELGKICYELFKSAPGEEVAQAVAEIDLIHERIDAINAEIEALKGKADDEIEVEVYEVEPAADEADAAQETPVEEPADAE